MASVKLDATKQQVETVLGKPQPEGSNEFFYEALDLRVRFKHGLVSQIQSFSTRQRASGVAVGSYRAALQRSYPRARCVEGPLAPTYLYCVVGSRFQGRPSYTGFLFEHPDGPIVEVKTAFGSLSWALQHS